MSRRQYAIYSLDTLSAARDLEAVGFNPQQAEAIVAAISRADEQLATKNDLAQLATKDDIAQLATKAEVEEIRSQIAQLATKAELEKFATKADLANFATKADLERFATKDDIAQFATKAELQANVVVLSTQIASLKSEFRWTLGFLAPFILAMAARMFDII